MDLRRVERLTAYIPQIGLFVLLGLALVAFAHYGWQVITYPYPVDYAEGPLLDQTRRLAQFENIYRTDLHRPPFTISNYPPLFLLAQVPLFWLIGEALWYGRLLAWLSMSAAALLIGLIVWELTRHRLGAWAGALSFVAMPYVSYWAPFDRVDATALALSLGGLWVILRKPESRRNVLWAAVLLTAAVYTRQSYGLAAPLAALAWLWLKAGRRKAIFLASTMVGLGLAVLAALSLLSGGGFVFNIVTANVNEYRYQLLLARVFFLFLDIPLLLILGIFFFLSGHSRTESWPLVATYWLGAVVVGLTLGKVGSNVNYLLEFCAASAIVIGALIAWQHRQPRVLNGLLILLALQVLAWLLFNRYEDTVARRLERREQLDGVMAVVQRAEGPVLADEDMGMLSLAGHPLYLQPFEMTELAYSGQWDQQPLLDAIARRDFSVILILKPPNQMIYEQRWTPEMLAQIERSYYVTDTLANRWIYRPRPE